MRRFAVALINHIEDEGLQLTVVKAVNWQEALAVAFPGYLAHLADRLDLPEAKEVAFDQEWEFDVQEIV